MPMSSQADSPAASLVGALGVFAVPDVLRLIAAGEHSGEVLVVANGLDGRLWLQDGALTGSAVRGTTTTAQAVFELALLEDGWFYFTSGRAAPEPGAPEEVEEILRVVLPQVVEWRDLLHRVPLDAVVTLAPTPPQAQVQLSAAEWQILAAIGGRGARVIDVVAATGRDQVQMVRTLRDMADAGLVGIATAPAAVAPVAAGSGPGTGPSSGRQSAGSLAGHRPPPPGAASSRRDPIAGGLPNPPTPSATTHTAPREPGTAVAGTSASSGTTMVGALSSVGTTAPGGGTVPGSATDASKAGAPAGTPARGAPAPGAAPADPTSGPASGPTADGSSGGDALLVPMAMAGGRLPGARTVASDPPLPPLPADEGIPGTAPVDSPIPEGSATEDFDTASAAGA